MKRETISLKDFASNRKIKSDFTTKAIITDDYTSQVDDITSNTATFVITTPSIDRVGDIVVTTGLNTENYLKNPVVLWQHDDSNLPIGKCTSLYAAPDGMIATVEFADFDTPFVGEKAAGIFSLIKQGILNTVSIGFNVSECYFNDFGGMTITDAELVEFSIVNIPCNRDALIVDHSEKSLTTTSTPVVAQDYADDDKAFVELPTAADQPEEHENLCSDEAEIPENQNTETNTDEKKKTQILLLERARQLRLIKFK